MTRTLLLALGLCALSPAFGQEAEQPKRSVIYFIGDGMGVSQVTLGRLGAAHTNRPYHLDRFQTIGLAGIRSANWLVTDSAAAGTALACGVKTNNQTVGQTPDGQPLESLIGVAHRSGYRTGMVTTTRLTHATPAAFVAHVEHRRKEKDIAAQMSARGYPEVLIGGGARNFGEAELAALDKHGYARPADLAALSGVSSGKVCALLAQSHLPFRIDGGPSLVDLTAKAVELMGGQPYVLMVEGGRIDHAGHQHDAAACLGDQLDFDAAVGWALDRAKQDPNLLVVVTADHATASLGIAEKVDFKKLLAAKASSELVAKSWKGTPKTKKARKAFGAKLNDAWGFWPTDPQIDWVFSRPGKYWARTALGHLASEQAGVYWFPLEAQEDQMKNTHGHDGGMVPVYAAGPDAGKFAGTYENDQIPRRIAEVLGLPAPGGKPPAQEPQGAAAQPRAGWY